MNIIKIPPRLNLKNWKSAEKELSSFIDVIWAKYIDHERVFQNLLAVIKYLKDLNWKVSKSLAYKHRDEGKIKAQPNGNYRLSDVEKYASTHLKKADGSKPDDLLMNLAEEKARVELDKEKEKLINLQNKNKMFAGAFVPREAFEKELAKRLAVLKSDGENFFRGGAEKTIAIIGGDPTKAPDLIDYQLDAFWNWLDRYAADREFKVPAQAIAAAMGDDKDEMDGEE